jgi:hypothetical protein
LALLFNVILSAQYDTGHVLPLASSKSQFF